MQLRELVQLPQEEEKDLLGLDSHYKGLAKFIRECDTPKTIAIEGRWGSGKTFAMNQVKKELEKPNDNGAAIKCINFNTWEYASIGYDNQLGSALLYRIHRELAGDLEKDNVSESGESTAETTGGKSQDGSNNQYGLSLWEQLEESAMRSPSSTTIELNDSNKTKLAIACIVLIVASVISLLFTIWTVRNIWNALCIFSVETLLDPNFEIAFGLAILAILASVATLTAFISCCVLRFARRVPRVLRCKTARRMLSTRPFNRATGMLSIDGNSLASVGLNLATQGAANIDPASFSQSDDKDMASLGKCLEKNARNVERIKSFLQIEIDRCLNHRDSSSNYSPEADKNKSRGRSRLLIFIDDLDRLQPVAAIGLLEDIQNFLDCYHCVFMLAMDADVVRTGVKEKYGEEYATPERQRQYLEKIVDVPYRLPAEGYGANDEFLKQYIHLSEEASSDKGQAQTTDGRAAADTSKQAGQTKAGAKDADKTALKEINIEEYKQSILLSGFNSSPRSITRAFDLQQLFKDIREKRDSSRNDSGNALDFIDFIIAMLQNGSAHRA